MNKILPIVLGVLNLVLLVFIIRGPAQDTAIKTEPTETATARPAATARPTPTPSPTPEPEPEAGDMSGTYRLTAVTSDGEEYGEDYLDMMAELDMVAMLYLRPDGTGTADLFGERDELTWTQGMLAIDGEPVPFSWEDGVLRIDADGDSMTFTRISDEIPEETSFELESVDDEPVVNPFSDVSADKWFYDAVMWAVKNHIVSGETFQPNAVCNRAQAMTFLWRAAGEPEPVLQVSPYADVKEDNYFYQPVLWAFENGIVSTAGDGKFHPDDALTKEQAATFLYRALDADATGLENPYLDVPEGSYYEKAARWFYWAGIVSLNDKYTFEGSSKVTRAQYVTFLYRALEDGAALEAGPVNKPSATPKPTATPAPTKAPTSQWNDVGRPSLSDFGWYFEDPTPSGAERMTSPAEISGRWKALNLYYDGGEIWARELLNVDIMAGDGSATVVYDWYYFYIDGGESYDETVDSDTTFYCSVSNGTSLYGGSDYGNLDISTFYRYYGAEYGIGSLMLPDGSVVQLALVRP